MFFFYEIKVSISHHMVSQNREILWNTDDGKLERVFNLMFKFANFVSKAWKRL